MRQTQEEPTQGGRGGLVIQVVLQALACSLEVVLHEPGTFGARYFGVQWAVAALMLVFFPGFFPNCDPSPMWAYAAGFVVFTIVGNVTAAKRRARGETTEHSRYNGTPVLMRVLRRAKEEHIKTGAEPVLALCTGAAVSEWNQALGVYLMIAAVALMLTAQLAERVTRVRVMDMHDAYLEQRRVTEQWRRMRRR